MELKYQLEDNIENKENLVYAFQQIVLFVASAAVLPATAGYTIGLSQPEVAFTLQRTFVLCGIMTILQMRFGHRFPIQHGPAGLWSGLFISMGTLMPMLGKPYNELQTDLQTGMIIGGSVIIFIALSGSLKYISKLFNPIINGTVMILMSVQVSASMLKGMLGVSTDSPELDIKSLIISSLTLLVIIILNYYCKGFIQSIAVFIGVIAGWALAGVLGVTVSGNNSGSMFLVPDIFVWGKPTFDPGVSITCVIGALVLLSMSFASIQSLSEVVDRRVSDRQLKTSIALHGAAAVFAGAGSSIAFMPYASSAGVVQMTGIASRKPLYWASVGMIILGIIGPIGVFFSTIPSCVGSPAILVIFAMIIGQAFKEISKITLTNREYLVLGLSLLGGIGIMFLPAGVFNQLPFVFSCLCSNGLIMGTVIAFLLEHIILRRKG